MQDLGVLNIGAIVTFLTTLGGAIAWLVRRRDGQKDPIPKESAAVALANSSVSIMQGIADRLMAEVADLRAELATERQTNAQDRDELRAQVTELSGDVGNLRSMFGVATGYIERLLRWSRADSRPPAPPLPAALRDHIDPALHD